MGTRTVPDWRARRVSSNASRRNTEDQPRYSAKIVRSAPLHEVLKLVDGDFRLALGEGLVGEADIELAADAQVALDDLVE